MSNVVTAPHQNKWLDLSRLSIYLSNERAVFGDMLLMFDKNGFLKDKLDLLDKIGFEPFSFELEYKLNGLLYRRKRSKSNEPLNSEDFTETLNIAPSMISLVDKNLVQVQRDFRAAISPFTNQRFDVLLRSRMLLGFSSDNAYVYGTYYGRLIRQFDSTMFSSDVSSINEAYLIIDPKSFNQIEVACRSLVLMSLRFNKAIGLKTLKKHAAVLFQRRAIDFDMSDEVITDFQLRQIQEAILYGYYRYLTNWGDQTVSNDSLKFTKKDFLTVTNTYLNMPVLRLDRQASSLRVGEQSSIESLLNSHPTPSPISMVAQMVLIRDAIPNVETKSILEPNYGFGALTYMVESFGFDVIGIENNIKYLNLIQAERIRTTVLNYDTLSCDYSSHNTGNKFHYVIANPHHQILPQAAYLKEDKSTNEKYYTHRTDYLTVFRSLEHRSADGRGVFILRMEHPQLAACKELITFIKFLEVQYELENIVGIPSNLYSVFSNNHHVCLLVVGKRYQANDKSTTSRSSILERVFKMVDSYTSLWAWADAVCERRSENFKILAKQYEYYEQELNILNDEFEALVNEKAYIASDSTLDEEHFYSDEYEEIKLEPHSTKAVSSLNNDSNPELDLEDLLYPQENEAMEHSMNLINNLAITKQQLQKQVMLTTNTNANENNGE